MKFVIVVVLFALALGAQSSVVPITVDIAHDPVVVHAAVPTVVAHPPAAVAVHAAVHPLHVVAAPVVVPQVVLPHVVPQVVLPHVVPHVVAVAPVEGTYIAKTRGAVHIAPLPGHVNSAASVNLEPAPGTV